MRHWLMKTEPDVFGIDDLERVRIEPWSGVRNPWARKYMREDMTVGDGVLFYHSSCVPPGVAGLARVVRTGVVDETQFDPAGKYYDAKASREAPVWWCVDVEFVEKLPRVVALDELRGKPELAQMMVLRIPRLSVQPVSETEYATVVAMAREPAPPPPPKPPRKPARKPATKPARKPKPRTKPKPRAKKPAARPKARPKPRRR
jgi:predicted RNA-binding protein with PUA-like domain